MQGDYDGIELLFLTSFTLVIFGSAYRRVPLNIQAILLKDLLYSVSPDLVDVPNHVTLDLEDLEPHARFAVFLYHRWVLKCFVSSTINGKPLKPNGVVGYDFSAATKKFHIMFSSEGLQKSKQILKFGRFFF